jgi:hypothetical protein
VNDAPAAIVPEFHAPLSDVDVCAMLSLFVHVTLSPTRMLIGFGEYALSLLPAAPVVIETGDPVAGGGGVGVGVGVGDGDGDGELDDPHPAANRLTSTANTHPELLRIRASMWLERVASSLPAGTAKNWPKVAVFGDRCSFVLRRGGESFRGA